ncbi:MAG TPA: dihydropteroate synthase [Desulfobacterales bacterium]|nr:dihydropteroate synthase [Desulfobacterales bacterium]
MHPRSVYRMEWGSHRLELGRRTCVMGVVNVTPDSFSDGGRFLDSRAAIDQGLRLAAAGADIIDVGGESTRPFSEPVLADEEIQRVVPVIAALAKTIRIPISIDTTKAAVARRALEAGAAMINDITALRSDPGLGALAAESGVPVVLMHMQGEPRTMQVAPRYDDLVAEIRLFLQQAADAAEERGVPRARLIVDPGIGFGKTAEHNLELIRRLPEFAGLGLPLLVGPSRKAFIRRLVKPEGDHDISPDHPAVETGTQAAVAAAILKGAHIVRVHDVANTRATLKVADAIMNS